MRAASTSPPAADEEPGRPRCHCGQALVTCGGCLTLRCLDCDPYRSDDCAFAL